MYLIKRMIKNSISFLSVFLVAILIIGFSIPSYSEYMSPKKQLDSGVSPEDIQCRDDRVLVLRTNGSPACVTERTVERTGWEILKTEFPVLEEIFDTNTNMDSVDNAELSENISSNEIPEIIILSVASSVEFVDDGREIKTVVQRGPSPLNIYDEIIQHQATGLSADSDGFIRIESVPHEKYSVNPGVGFYAEDFIPTYIPDGYKLLYSETSQHPLSGNYRLGLTFVPNTYELNENVTNSDMKYNKGFIVFIQKKTTPLDEIEDIIEHLKERRESQPNNYGGFRDMTRDGKTVMAYEGGNHFNRYQAIVDYNYDDFTSHSVSSFYHTLDELIPIFESFGN